MLAKATEVFGPQAAAEAWISEPVMGLDRQVPLDLLQTPAGVDLVNAFLTRLEYGVYTCPRCRRRTGPAAMCLRRLDPARKFASTWDSGEGAFHAAPVAVGIHL